MREQQNNLSEKNKKGPAIKQLPAMEQMIDNQRKMTI